MTFTDGVAAFTLKHSESKTAEGLSAGTTYTVTETEADQDGYVTAKTGKTGIIGYERVAVSLFNNHKDNNNKSDDLNDSGVDKITPEEVDKSISNDQTLNRLTNNTPKTGYKTNSLTPWMALMGISCSGIITILVVVVRKRQKKYKR